jgi:hypothetical protein
MHDEGLTKEIAAERATITRDLLKPEDLDKVCKVAGEVGHCTITAGMGLGWEVETVNGVKILNHDGSDWGVKTFAMFVPSQGIGVIVFTNGENGTVICQTGHSRSSFERYSQNVEFWNLPPVNTKRRRPVP